jgi:hypothetical protein
MMKNKRRVKAQRDKEEKLNRQLWYKNHPIVECENGKFSIINIGNSLADYDDKREELEQFEEGNIHAQEEREEFIHNDDDYFDTNDYEGSAGNDNDWKEIIVEDGQLLEVGKNDNNIIKNSILQQVDALQMKLKLFQCPEDDKIPLSNLCFRTKGEFARSYSEMCSTLRLDTSAQSTILEFMYNFNPNQSLPIKISENGNFISTVKNYVPPSNRLLEFETCIGGCVVYSDKRYQHLRRCPCCNLERYNECTLASCKKLKYDDCPHSDIGREAKTYLYYRPIIPLLITLLDKPDFILALNYKFVKQFDNNYEDVQDGKHYKDNYAEMDEVYYDFCKKNSLQEWTKINILLSQFYDGVKIYDHKVVDFWPLIITILNLPPTLRNQTGVGTFLLSIFSNSLSSAAEKYLFENCLVEELQELYKGLTINNKFFVQVRLIQHCLDTKAIGKQLNTHEANSLIGCPLCRELPGSSRHALNIKKIVYSGYRLLLPLNNILRYIGRSKLCCPPGFYGLSCKEDELERHRNNNFEMYNAYSNNFKKIKENLISEFVPVYQQRLMKRKIIPSWIISCIPNSETTNLHIQNFYEQKNINNVYDEPFYQWFHTQEDDTKNPYYHGKFSTSMYFVHCDLRPTRDLTRRTQIEFANDGLIADNLSNRIPIKERHVNGVKGSWFGSKLKNGNVKRDVNFDGFHCLSGISNHIISMVKGDVTTVSKQYCMETKIFPFLHNSNSPESAPWELNMFEQCKVDAWIDAILIPKSYAGTTFQIERLFAATGYVRGKSFIDVFSILINYLNLAMSTIPDEYKNFFSMLGEKFRNILRYTFCDEEVEELHYKIIETMSVYEGLFSEKECTFLCHEFLHLSRHIPIMGPLHGWWTFSGERTNSFIKKFVPIGGRSFDKTCMNAYNKCETAITESAFNDRRFFENDVRFSIKNENNKQQLEFDFHCFYFFSQITFNKSQNVFFPEFNCFEKNCLVSIFLAEIVKISENHNSAMQRSSLYRLYYSYKLNNNSYNKSNNKIISFKNWLFLISLYSNDGKQQTIPLSIEEKTLLFILEPFIEGSSKYSFDSDDINNTVNKYKYISKNEIKTAISIVDLLEYQKEIKIFRNAIIYGNRFSARDHSFAEKGHMIRDPTQYGSSTYKYKTNNSKNNLQIFKQWSAKDDYSSWCRYRIINASVSNNFEFNCTNKDYYGRLNYFFRINCETDSILHGLGMANVSPRSYETINLVDRIPCDEYVTMNSKEATVSYLTFTPITNIYPTPILVSPFDVNNLPIIIKHKKNLLRKNQYSTNFDKLSYFLVNDLKPSEVLSEEQMKVFDKTKFDKNYNSFSKDKITL